MNRWAIIELFSPMIKITRQQAFRSIGRVL